MGFHKWRSEKKTWEVLKPRARELRQEQTPAEAILWARLRNGQLAGRRFRRQHALGAFIADFFCPAARLVVELDGGIHEGRSEEDAHRDRELATRGLRVIRIQNDDVMTKTEDVLERIRQAILEIENIAR